MGKAKKYGVLWFGFVLVLMFTSLLSGVFLGSLIRKLAVALGLSLIVKAVVTLVASIALGSFWYMFTNWAERKLFDVTPLFFLTKARKEAA